MQYRDILRVPLVDMLRLTSVDRHRHDNRRPETPQGHITVRRFTVLLR